MEVTMNYAALKVLKKAEELIEIGWCQGTYSKKIDENTFAFCALGALCKAQIDLGYGYGNQPLITASAKIASAIGKEPDGGWLSQWNDEPTRIKEEVLDAFKKAQKL